MRITGKLEIGGVVYEIVGNAVAKSDGLVAGKNKTMPKLPDDYKTREVMFERYGSKSGSSAKGDWVRHYAVDSVQDQWFSTFDFALGMQLEKLANAGQTANIAYTENDRGATFCGLVNGGDVGGAAGADDKKDDDDETAQDMIDAMAGAIDEAEDDDDTEMPF